MSAHERIVVMLIAMFRSLFSEEYQVWSTIADLADDDIENASAAAQTLGESNAPEAVPALLAALSMSREETPPDDPHAAAQLVDFRQDVVRALGKLRGEQAIPYLEAVAADDPDLGVRDEAVAALRRIRGEGAAGEA